MKITTMPKETAAELLLFLADNERFSSVTRQLGEGVKVEEVRALLRELATELGRQGSEEGELATGIGPEGWLSTQAKDVLSSLSPQDEATLLDAFGLKDK